MAKADNGKAEIVTVKVARGKSVEFDGELHLPGATFEIELSEALDLHKKGFVVDPGAEPEEAESAGPAITTE